VFNRLVKVTKAADGSTVAEYVYDGTGRRVLKTVGSDETRYIYDGNDVICEYNGNDALVCRYIMGRSIDEPLRMERLIDSEWRTFYYHTNQLGSIVALTEWDSGEEEETIIERYTYDAYGRMGVQTPGADGTFGTSDDDYSPTSSVGNPYGFTARRLDEETGLMYYRARYYSTVQGRFVGRDPEGYKDGMSLYFYARCNSLRYTDSLGKQACEDENLPPWLKAWIRELKKMIKRLPAGQQEQALKALDHFVAQKQPWEQQLGLRLLGMTIQGSRMGMFEPDKFSAVIAESKDIVKKVSHLMTLHGQGHDCHGWADSFANLVNTNTRSFFKAEKVWRLNPVSEKGPAFFHQATTIYLKGMEKFKGVAPVIDRAARYREDKIQGVAGWVSNSAFSVSGFGNHPLSFEVKDIIGNSVSNRPTPLGLAPYGVGAW